MSMFSEKDLHPINELLKSSFLSSDGDRDISGWFHNNEGGPYLRQFQEVFAGFCGAKHAFALSGGSASIYTALKACGVGRGDKVAVPSYTHIGSVAPIVLAGGEPVFVDVNERGNMDPEDLRRVVKEDFKAVIVIHQLGLPCEMDAIKDASKGLFIIEDASHALGAEYRGKKAGVLGDIGCFSVGGGRTKTIGTGEGGMIVTDDDELAEKCKNIRNNGDRYFDVDYFCFNFRMSDLNALVGLVQMSKLQDLIDWQVRHAKYLIENLPNYLTAWHVDLPSHVKSIFYIIGCRFTGKDRDGFLKKVREGGYEGGVPRKFVGGGYSKLISNVRYYTRYSRTSRLHKTLTKLPMSVKLINESVWIDWHRHPRTKDEIDDLLGFLEGI